MRRWLVTGGVLVVLAVVGIGGWWAAGTTVSPEQQEAAARPPSAAPVLVTVERSRLTEDLVMRADIRPRGSYDVPIAAPDGPAYVTATPVAVGDELQPGRPALEVNGRPVLALPGKFPFYRDIGPGDEGPDVAQLQEALRAAGHAVVVDGEFGQGTARAVAELYDDAGYEPPTRPSADPADPGTGASTDETELGEPDAPARSAGEAEEAEVPTPRDVVYLPAAETVVSEALPAVLASRPGVGAAVGAETSIGLSSGTLIATSDIPASVFARLAEGLAVAVEGPDGETIAGRLPSLDGVEADDEGIRRIPLGDLDIPAGWKGENLLTTVTLATGESPGLVIPTRAVAAGAAPDAGSVLVARADGTLETVAVRVVAELSGRCMVEPQEPSGLQEGDRVRVDVPTSSEPDSTVGEGAGT